MSEHHSCTQDYGYRISSVSSHNVTGDVTASWFKQCVFLRCDFSGGVRCEGSFITHSSYITPRNNARSTDEGSTDVRYNGTIQIGIIMTSN